MYFKNTVRLSAISGLALMMALPAHAQMNARTTTPSMEEMWAVIQSQKAKIEALEREVEMSKIDTLEVKEHVASVADVIDNEAIGPSVSSTQIGGYGELHYEGGAKDEIDFHRFVLFFGHEFTDNIRFFSELELEHAIAGEGQPGEIELEQAYIEMDINDSTQLYGGVRLVPVGILNETHEPPTFYGVERNAVERNIIPATWWEGGLGVHGNIGSSGLSYDAMISSGLDLNVGNGYKIRSGRQKTGQAKFKSQAYTGRVQYTGLPGITLASSLFYQPDVTQKSGDSITGEDVSGLLWTANLQAKHKGFGLNGLYAAWNLDGADVQASGRNKQNGFYIEPSYKFNVPMSLLEDAQLGVFYRYSQWDNNNGVEGNTGVNRNVFGVNYWPINDVVLKLDYIIEDKDSAANNSKSLNLGIGYQF